MAEEVKSSCPHCNNENIKAVDSSKTDARGHIWLTTKYSCDKCKFSGEHSERIPKPK